MQFQFSFKQMSSSDALRDYAQNKIAEVAERFVAKPIDAHVTFVVEHKDFTARCTFNGGDGFNFQVEHTCDDMYRAVDHLVDKLEAQLKRKKEKIKTHKGNTNVRSLADGTSGGKPKSSEEIDAEDILKFEAARKRLGGAASR